MSFLSYLSPQQITYAKPYAQDLGYNRTWKHIFSSHHLYLEMKVLDPHRKFSSPFMRSLNNMLECVWALFIGLHFTILLIALIYAFQYLGQEVSFVVPIKRMEKQTKWLCEVDTEKVSMRPGTRNHITWGFTVGTCFLFMLPLNSIETGHLKSRQYSDMLS